MNSQHCRASQPRPHRLHRGLTLIELMVVIAIIGVIAGIAYPQYTNYVKKGHRAAAQSEMMMVANAQQQYLMANRSYAASEAALNTSFTSAVTSNYGCAITNPAGAAVSFLITCTPSAGGAMSGDVTLTLSSDGTRTPASSW